jgi:hypothetical protein
MPPYTRVHGTDKLQLAKPIGATEPDLQTSSINDAAKKGVSERGSVDADAHKYNANDSSAKETIDASSEMYVSVLNPVGEAPYLPSKTKPLPRWMSLLPNNYKEKRKHPQNGLGKTCTYHSHHSQMSNEGYACEEDGILSEIQIEDFSGENTSKTLSRYSIASSDPIGTPDKGKHPKGIKISLNSNPNREHTFESPDRRGRRSQTVESVYMTPPERPSAYFPPTQQTSYSGTFQSFKGSTLRGLKRSSSDPSKVSTNIYEGVQDRCCSLGSSVLGSSPKRLYPKPSPSWARVSSEYLDRSRLQSGDSQYQKCIAKKAEHIIDKMKRQSGGKQKVVGTQDQKWFKSGCEKHELDATREDLKKELRSLFCEE